MFCPTCQTVAPGEPEAQAFCPTCGDAMRAIAASDTFGVVESTAAIEAGAQPADDLLMEIGETALTVTREEQRLPVLARLPELPALAAMAWQQPMVRAAVKTGASAIALSLAARAARSLLTRRAPQRAISQYTLPSLAELFQREDAPRRSRRGQGIEVSETFIYIRHVRRVGR